MNEELALRPAPHLQPECHRRRNKRREAGSGSQWLRLRGQSATHLKLGSTPRRTQAAHSRHVTRAGRFADPLGYQDDPTAASSLGFLPGGVEGGIVASVQGAVPFNARLAGRCSRRPARRESPTPAPPAP